MIAQERKKMLKFKEFITEQEDMVIDDIPEQVLIQVETINTELESVTSEPFVNSAIFVNCIRNTLERYGIILPPGYEMPLLSLDAESAYSLGDSGLYLYLVHSTEENGVEGYAQIVDKQDLDDLMSSEMMGGDGPEEMSKPWIPPARRDDDSGNDAEYA